MQGNSDSPDDLLSSLKNILSSNESEPSQDPDPFPINPALLATLAKTMSGGDDKNTALIASLKPYLSERRQVKADEAIKLLKLLSILPTLKESGLLSSIL